VGQRLTAKPSNGFPQHPARHYIYGTKEKGGPSGPPFPAFEFAIDQRE
jgi:hypothetical protein